MAVTDELIKEEIVQRLVRDDRVDAARVTVSVHDGKVVLTGEVGCFPSRVSAAEDAAAVVGVHEVENRIAVVSAKPVTQPVDRRTM